MSGLLTSVWCEHTYNPSIRNVINNGWLLQIAMFFVWSDCYFKKEKNKQKKKKNKPEQTYQVTENTKVE